MDENAIESKIKSLLPKLRELQKSIGIHKIDVNLIREFRYIIYKFKLRNARVNIRIKAPTYMKEQIWKIEKEISILTYESGLNANVFTRYSPVGYPLVWPNVFTNVETKEEVRISDKGKHLLIFCCRLFSLRTSNPFAQFLQEFRKHSEWIKNFRVIVCLSEADDTSLIKTILEQDMDKICEYCRIQTKDVIGSKLTEWFKTEIQYMLVNKNMIIEAFSKLGQGMLESQIEQMLRGENIWNKVKKHSKKNHTEIIEDIEQFAESRTDILIETCTGLLCDLNTITHYDLKTGIAAEKIPSMNLVIDCPESNQELVYNILQELNALYCNSVKLTMALKNSTVRSIEIGNLCGKCGKNIQGCKQFRCIECNPPFYLCYECGNVPELKTPNDLPHKHLMFYIREESDKFLQRICYQTLKTKTKEDITPDICLGCNEAITGTNWICLNCTIRLCTKCFLKSKDPQNNESDFVVRLRGMGHNEKKHVYQKFKNFE